MGKPVAALFQAVAHRADPAAKVLRDQLMRRAILGIDLERQPSQRASVLAVGLEDADAIARQDREDAFDRIAGLPERRIDHLRTESFQILFEHRFQQSLLALEEVVEAAAVDPACASRSAMLVPAKPRSQKRNSAEWISRSRVGDGFAMQKTLDVFIILVFT